MESMTVDEAKRMGELAQILSKPDAEASSSPPSSPSPSPSPSATEAEKLAALDELESFVESIDNAKNLFIVGGFEPLLDCLRSSLSLAIRRRAADVLAVVVQNNPRAQEWALESGCMTVVANALAGRGLAASASGSGGSSSSSNGAGAAAAALSTRASALTALSALVRDNKEGQQRLVRRGDVELVTAGIREWSDYVRADDAGGGAAAESGVGKAGRRFARKSLFFLRHLVAGAEADAIMSAVLSSPSPPGLVPQLLEVVTAASTTAAFADDPDAADARDNALHVLLALVSPTVAFEGVVDDSGDNRKPKGILNRIARTAAAGESAAGAVAPASAAAPEAPLLLLGPPSGDAALAGAGAAGPASTVLALGAPSGAASGSSRRAPSTALAAVTSGPDALVVLTLAERRAVVAGTGAAAVLEGHLAWLAAQAAAGRGGEEGEEAETARRVVAELLRVGG
jgi:hypothetical protein